ncbi:hypothetical protein Vafri_9449, partial [Volvox africanus]
DLQNTPNAVLSRAVWSVDRTQRNQTEPCARFPGAMSPSPTCHSPYRCINVLKQLMITHTDRDPEVAAVAVPGTPPPPPPPPPPPLPPPPPPLFRPLPSPLPNDASGDFKDPTDLVPCTTCTCCDGGNGRISDVCSVDKLMAGLEEDAGWGVGGPTATSGADLLGKERK